MNSAALNMVYNTNTMWYHLYVECKIWHKWTYLWNRNRLTDKENRLVIAKIGWRRDALGVWDSRCKVLYTEWINKKVLLYSTGNHWTESLCSTPETNTTLDKIPNNQSSLEKEEQNWRHHAPWFQTVSQSYSNQNSMVLA